MHCASDSISSLHRSTPAEKGPGLCCEYYHGTALRVARVRPSVRPSLQPTRASSVHSARRELGPPNGRETNAEADPPTSRGATTLSLRGQRRRRPHVWGLSAAAEVSCVGTFARRENRWCRLLGLGMRHDVLDRVGDGEDLVGLGVGDFDGELLLNRHDELDGVERVEAEVLERDLGRHGRVVDLVVVLDHRHDAVGGLVLLDERRERPDDGRADRTATGRAGRHRGGGSEQRRDAQSELAGRPSHLACRRFFSYSVRR
mmetsp:Transcript_25617/g.102133  ORF Transcript_25617/g.102133 Transcript_25617/m.102133 type:complete len:259 (-) Transcript_25617:2-778(-)